MQVWISNGIFKAEMMKNIDKTGELKDIDKAGKPIKKQDKKSSKKLKFDLTNIEKSSKEIILITKEQ